VRIVNQNGRLGLLRPSGLVDVEQASDGRFGSDVQAVYDQWADFVAWAGSLGEAPTQPREDAALGSPVPRPRQVFGIGMNYLDHAEEAAMEASTTTMVVFTKFPSSVAGPYDTVELPGGPVDYEVELVVVMGAAAHRVSRDQAWSYVAGVTLGQDLSEREVQFRGPNPQFNLGKSFPGFSPMGPELVTVDELADPDDMEIACELNGQQMQKGRTSQMIFPVPAIISSLSQTLTLLPGDVIFTGTPAGIGWARDPKVLLQPGDELVSSAPEIGTLRHGFVART